MLQNWLKGISIKNEDFEKHQLGSKVLLHHKNMPKLNKVKAVLIGIEAKESNAVRKELYALSHQFPNFGIADLGNVRKKEVSFIIPILREILGTGRTLILIGKDLEWIKAQQQAHRQTRKYTNNWLSIDDRVRLDGSFRAGHRIIIGGQKHLSSRADVQKIEKKNWEYYSLGSSRANLKATEPSIRDADFATFNMAALKSLEAPQQLSATPSGFFLEEACQLTYYAGISDKLTAIGFYGFQAAASDQRSPQALAQLIWYFLEGLYYRKQDYPVSKEGMAEYLVHIKKYDLTITFWKSLKSGRWWLQLPNKKTQNRLIPCAYEDYQAAGQGEISDRLLGILERDK
ncbi:MAG: hypothetical protein AAF849_18855 [Bacteroidota bacterium]